MAVLTSEYQYLGRSEGMTAKSGYATYYLLLYGKAVPNNDTGIYKVSIKFYIASNKNSTFYWYTTNYNGKINNTQVFGSTTDKEPRDEWELSSFKAGDDTYNKATFIKEGSLDIDCSNGLSKDIPLSAYWKIVNDDGDTYVPASGTNRTVSVTATLPAIPRASTLDSFSGSKRIGVSNDVIINFTKKNSAFTTTLEYATKSDFSDAVTIVNKTSNASTYSWTIPISLLNKIPNSKTLPIYIRLTTYNGDTQIGTAQTSSFTANVYSENCKPIWNTHTIEETESFAKQLVTTANKFIANMSKPKFTFSATGQYGATIKYYQINNVTRTSGFTDDSFNINGYNLKVVDSRGIENTYKFNLSYVPYFTPIFEEVKLFRNVPTGSKVFSYFRIKFFNNTSSVKFDNPQALSYKFNYQETGGTAQEVSITPTTSDSETSRTAENETELGTTFNYKKSIDWTFFFVDLTGKTFKTGNTLPMGVPLVNGKMNSNGEQELAVNGNFKAETLQNVYACASNGATPNRWQRLCTIKRPGHSQGSFAFLRIHIGDGNNGGDYQNAYIDLTLQQGWTGSHEGRYGCNFILNPICTSFNLSNVNVRVRSLDLYNYEVWFYTTKSYCRPSYSYDVDTGITLVHDGNTFLTSEPTGTICQMKGISTALQAYPVGALYLTLGSEDPKNIFGGTWEKITDVFLIGAGNTYSIGSTGGSKDAIVVEHTHTEVTAGGHTHSIGGDLDAQYTSSGTKSWSIHKATTGYGSLVGTTNSAGGHTHTINKTGSSGAGKNLPPYKAVYFWRRTA